MFRQKQTMQVVLTNRPAGMVFSQAETAALLFTQTRTQNNNERVVATEAHAEIVNQIVVAARAAAIAAQPTGKPVTEKQSSAEYIAAEGAFSFALQASALIAPLARLWIAVGGVKEETASDVAICRANIRELLAFLRDRGAYNMLPESGNPVMENAYLSFVVVFSENTESPAMSRFKGTCAAIRPTAGQFQFAIAEQSAELVQGWVAEHVITQSPEGARLTGHADSIMVALEEAVATFNTLVGKAMRSGMLVIEVQEKSKVIKDLINRALSEAKALRKAAVQVAVDASLKAAETSASQHDVNVAAVVAPLVGFVEIAEAVTAQAVVLANLARMMAADPDADKSDPAAEKMRINIAKSNAAAFYHMASLLLASAKKVATQIKTLLSPIVGVERGEAVERVITLLDAAIARFTADAAMAQEEALSTEAEPVIHQSREAAAPSSTKAKQILAGIEERMQSIIQKEMGMLERRARNNRATLQGSVEERQPQAVTVEATVTTVSGASAHADSANEEHHRSCRR